MSLSAAAVVPARIEARGFGVEVDGSWRLADVKVELPGGVTALLGEPGAGHQTFAGALSRSLEVEHRTRVTGRLCLDGQDVYEVDASPHGVRRRIPTLRTTEAFPGTVFDDVAFGLRAAGELQRGRLVGPVEAALRRVDLWARVGERLDMPSAALPAAFGPHLALARALTLRPEAIVLDLPRGELDALAVLLADWGPEPAMLVVAHRVDRVVRRARTLAFFEAGRLIEVGPAPALLTRPKTAALEAFLRRGAAG